MPPSDPTILNDDFLKHSETSDSRPYKFSIITSQYNHPIVQENQDENENNLHEQHLIQDENLTADQQQNTHPMQNITEVLEETITKPPSLTVTTGSYVLNVAVRQITENDNRSLNQDDASTLSTLKTNNTQKHQTRQTIPQNFDPPPLPSENSTHTVPHDSPE